MSGRHFFFIIFFVLLKTVSAFRTHLVTKHLNRIYLQRELEFTNQEAYLTYLESISSLPKGFSIASSKFFFSPYEVRGRGYEMFTAL